ncbi:MAG: 3-oxoacyl-ACP reductase FabG [bacterium]|nr:3-oxoacyl-ACP reductase FabG [bacterium]
MKNILITGASHGIGKAIAARFAADGANLILNCKTDGHLLEQYANELSEKYCVKTLVCVGDVSDDSFVREMFDTAEKKIGGIDILVNNAGISWIGLLTDMSLEQWHRVLDTNLTSVFSCCKAAIPHMVHRKSGCIINISSVWGNVGASCEVAYCASKGGMNSFTRALAKELAPSNITVNAIACGIVDTRMNSCFSNEERTALADEVPMGRFASPDEIAQVAWQLANSPAYLTGQVISVDGGWQ